MRSPRLFKLEHRGFLIIDAIIAIAVASIWISVIGETTSKIRNLNMRVENFQRSIAASSGKIFDFGIEDIGKTIPIPSRSCADDLISMRLYLSGQSDQNVSHELVSSGNISALITPIILPLNYNLILTDMVIRNDKAYISADSQISGDPDIFIFDISDDEHPIILSSLNTGPGLASIALAGRRILGAAMSTAYQIHSIHIDDPQHLILENRYRLPSPAPSTSPAFASAISYNNRKIYLGSEKWPGYELSVYDIQNNGELAYGFGWETSSKINDILASSSLLVLAGSGREQISILNIDNGVIASSTSFDLPGWERQNGRALEMWGGHKVLGRDPGGFDISADHELFVFSSSSRSDITWSMNIPGGVYGFVSDTDHLYMIARRLGFEFQVIGFDKEGGQYDVLAVFPLPTDPKTLTCDGGDIYVLSANVPVIYKISLFEKHI